MTDGLTARQTQILKALIDEYIETAAPVGSSGLEKKYNLGVSPATIRNEMAVLTKMKYLQQPHTSAGRVPTPTAMKFYINQLMEEKQMSLADEVKTKEEVMGVKEDLDDLLTETTRALSDQTRSLALAMLDEVEKVWHAGYAHVFDYPEFTDLSICSSLFSLLETRNRLREVFLDHFEERSPIEVLFGEDFGWSDPLPIGIAMTHFQVKGKNGTLGVIGPVRSRYPVIIPVLRHFSNLLSQIA